MHKEPRLLTSAALAEPLFKCLKFKLNEIKQWHETVFGLSVILHQELKTAS